MLAPAIILATAVLGGLPQGPVVSPVVRTGDAAPDGNGVVESFVLEPVLNKIGTVAIACRLGQTKHGALDNEALIAGDTGEWRILLREGDPAPGGGVFRAFAEGIIPAFFPPGIDDDGNIITLTTIEDGGFFHPALVLIRPDESVTLIVRAQTPSPAGGTFGEILGGVEPLRRGQTVFFIDRETQGGTLTRDVWRFDGSSIHRLIGLGDPSPDGLGIVEAFDSGWSTIDDNGHAVFSMNVRVGAFSVDTVVVRADAAGLHVIARRGATIGGAGRMLAGGRPVLNASCQLGMVLLVTQGNFISERLFGSDGGELFPLIGSGDALPRSMLTVRGLLNPAVAPDGRLATLAAFHFGDDGSATDAGIIHGDDSGFTLQLRTGDQLPHGGTVSTSILPPSVNDQGLLATFVTTAEEPEVSVLLVKRLSASLTELVRTGDLLDQDRVITLGLPAIENNGGRGPLNDRDQLAFRADFESGGAGIYLAQIAPPPPCPGDANGDGAVTGADLSVLLATFSQIITPGTGGDFNGDGLVNGADLSVLLAGFGTLCPV